MDRFFNLKKKNNFIGAKILQEKIQFIDIPKLIEASCEIHKSDWKKDPSLEDILLVDKWSRKIVQEQVKKILS